MMKTILVTGGLGFIGSHTCVKLLEKGYKILILDSLINSSIKVIDRIKKITLDVKYDVNENLKFYKCDLRDEFKLESIFKQNTSDKKKIDAVIHFSGLKAVSESVKDPLKYYDFNVLSTINLLKIMDKFDCKKIVFSSSATIYGNNCEDSNIKEDAPINPINPYGITKVVIENILQNLFLGSNSWSVSILRYFNPIGAHPSGLIGESPLKTPTNIFPIINEVASGERKNLNIFGNDWDTFDGTGIRDYIHVMDLADGHVLALEYLFKNVGEIIKLNLGTGNGTSVLELISTFKSVNNIEIPYLFTQRRKGDVSRAVADISLAKEKLNWFPIRDLKTMCKDGWEWKKQNINGYF